MKGEPKLQVLSILNVAILQLIWSDNPLFSE